MNKKVVVRVAARGYVDGRYIGEEKEVIESVDPSGRGKRGRGKPAGSRGARGGTKNSASRGSVLGNDDRGNRVSRGGRGNSSATGNNTGNGSADGARRRSSAGGTANAQGNRQNRPPRGPRRDGQAGQVGQAGQPNQQGRPRNARNPRNSQTPRDAQNTQKIGTEGNSNVDGNFVPGVSPPRSPRAARPPRSDRAPRQARGQGRGERKGPTRAGYSVTIGAGDAAGNLVQDGVGNAFGSDNFGNGVGGNPPRARRNRGGKKTPFRTAANNQSSQSSQAFQPGFGQRALISEVAETMRWGADAKSGQFAEALAKEEVVKRERLHKVLAQSGHGSRRDMEIMITSGRVMVNGIVATTGTSVSASDAVMVDKRLVKLKFNEELPRVLLYHKPDGEIVTTNDPGNRITVFDNLPRVENGKWMSIGRLDINTSGLLIFTTSGELANRLMHPRYEVEREYAVRILGELTEEQTAQLLAGISIASLTGTAATNAPTLANDADINDYDYDDAQADDELETENFDDRPAKFDSIEARGGEGANHWYHVVLREGRNREVRKMFEAVGLTVSRLIRVRFGKIGLPPRLTRGRMMELDDSQARAVLRWVGMEVEGHIGALPTNHQPNRGQRPDSRGARGDRGERGARSEGSGRDQPPSNADVPTIGEDGVQIAADANQRGDRNGERGSRGDKGKRGGRNRQRSPRAVATEPAVEGQDFVAGEAAVRAFTESIGESNESSLSPRPANVRTPRRGRSRNVRRGRDVSERPTADMNNAFAGSDGNSGSNVGNQVAPVMARTERSDDDAAGNRVTPDSANMTANVASGEPSATRKPRAPRKPKVEIETDDNAGNR